jgi:hypothetical protein
MPGDVPVLHLLLPNQLGNLKVIARGVVRVISSGVAKAHVAATPSPSF